MSAPELSFEMYRGDTKVIQVTIVDGAGSPMSLVGVQSIKWQMSKRNNSGGFSVTPVLQFGLGTGVAMISPATGRCDITLTSANTAALGAADYYHEMEVIDSLSRVQTVLQGTITLLKDLVVNP